MAIEYISGEKVSQTALAKEMNTGPACSGTCIENVSLPFRNRGWNLASEVHTTLGGLKEQNSQGYVSIINIHFDTDHKFGHYVVVVGYNTTGIIVHDAYPTSWDQPNSRRTGANAFISNQLLADLWTRHDQWALKVPYAFQLVPEFPLAAFALLATLVLATILLARKPRAYP